MSSSFEILLNKLDRFIRRYYLNQLIKGSLFFGAGLIIIFILFISFEYFGYLSTNVRFVLFYGFLLFNLFVFIKYVLIPLLGMLRIGRKIGPEQAADIIGKHYRSELNDKITNVLQLKKYLSENPENAALIIAGIDQKTNQIIPLPFQRAIPLKGNLRLVPYFVIPLLFVGIFYLLQPAFIIEPASRIVQYDTHFERPRPFDIQMISEKTAFRQEDVEIRVEASGQIVPASANMRLNGGNFRMNEEKTGVFSRTVRNVQDNLYFFIEAQGFNFGPFAVEVYEKPSISHFHIDVEYPDYTGLSPDSYSNMGDLSAIRASQIKFTFYTDGNSEILFKIEDKKIPSEQVRRGVFQVETVAEESFEYSVFALNKEHGKGDSLRYYVNVQADAYPRIAVEEHRDDVLLAHLFYRGTIEDDFGFTTLYFKYRTMDQRQINRGENVPFFSETVTIDPNLRNQTFYHYFDLQSIYVQPGETVEIYFEVLDNDMINGPKASRSQLFTYYIPTEDEILAEQRATEERVEQGLSDGIGEVRQARDQIEELRKQLLDSDRIGWEQREMLQELLNKKDQMEEKIRDMADEQRDTDTRSEQFRESNERLKEKQEELQQLFDEVLTDELKELFDMIRQELENMDRDQVYEMLEQMEFEFRDLEHQMDRTLEMFRQFAMERMLQESIDQLKELAEKQQALKEDTLGEGDADEIAGEQEDINKGFERVQDLLEQFRETNEKLQRPNELMETGEFEESIMQDLENALDQLQMQNRDMAAPSQQDAGNKMESLSDMLTDMQQQIFQQQLAEDARAIRMLLENLLRSSFAQEDLMEETRQANVNDPRYLEMIREQRKIKSDMQMIEDSLIALSARQAAIKPFVNREIAEIHMQTEQGINLLINRRRHQAATRQQLIMTHINNLALMLNESLQEVQQQMAMGQGTGNDSDMGEGMPSFQDLSEMQEMLNEMLQQIQEGQQPMPGETGEPGMSMSEQMARMAAEQEAIRNQLRQLTDEMRNQGREVGEEFDQLQRDMERSELEMLRKELSTRTIMRQEQILTRLLEHHRAELQREQEARREGTTAKDYDLSNPEDFFEYNRIREREVDMLRSLPPGLRPFYRSLVEQYFLHVD